MNSRKVMRQQGKTFYWATCFLPEDEPEDISILYAFCRYVDDLIDIKKSSCDPIKQDLQKMESSIKEVQRLLQMAKRRSISLEPLKILLETLEKDQSGISIETWAELKRYCYGVASTVGLMMCDILKVNDARAAPFAIDLGIGMQLTNIARDIYEDALNQRVYLPQEALKTPLSPLKICQAIQNRSSLQLELIGVQEEILKLADLYYASADQGMHFLPRSARLTIITASRLYQAKGLTIRKNPQRFLTKRADVPFAMKLYHTLRAIGSFIFNPNYRAGSTCCHNPQLHRDLFSLPATNPP